MDIVKDEDIKIRITIDSKCPLCGKKNHSYPAVEVTEYTQYLFVSCNHESGCGADYVISGKLIFKHNTHAITNMKSEAE